MKQLTNIRNFQTRFNGYEKNAWISKANFTQIFIIASLQANLEDPTV